MEHSPECVSIFSQVGCTARESRTARWNMRSTTRRQFLGSSLGTGAAAFLSWPTGPFLLQPSIDAALQEPLADPVPGGRLVRTLLFEDRKRGHRRNVAYGAGLNGRLRLDLAELTPRTLVTPNEKFYIRTRCPALIDCSRPWRIRVHGRVAQPLDLSMEELKPLVEPMGVHLLECSGNGTSGLISAANWSGIAIERIFDKCRARRDATRVLISGFDQHEDVNPRSTEPGASWVFTVEQLKRAGAFLATKMNAKPLPKDHGYPIRLVMPGWYGCTCIKWLNELKFVDDKARATVHMGEFASRTHQDGKPGLARDYEPATIDLAAMPVRVEKWSVSGKLVYRVVGIIWGGDKPSNALAIRFGRDPRYVRVENCEYSDTRTWSLWSHTWRPTRPGRYRIRLRIDDAGIRTRRLDSHYYARVVKIAEV